MAPTTQTAALRLNEIDIPSTIDQLVQLLSTNVPVAAQHHVLKALPKEGREHLLASPLAGGDDPLTVLPVERSTLGWLFIL